MVDSTMLLISDDLGLVETMRLIVRSVDHLGLEVVPGCGEASSLRSWDRIALVLIHLPGRGSPAEFRALLREIAEARRPIATLVVGEGHDADRASEWLRLGVADFLAWPPDVDRLIYLVEILTVRARHAGMTVPAPKATIPWLPTPGPARKSIGSAGPVPDDDTPETSLLMEQVRRVAPQDTTILLGGETGTGKTRLAHLIHEISDRRAEPFLVVNCGALSANLIESEMFGHVRGSFTGADRDRVGKFAVVGRGTLFLDEIDTLPLSVQSKLLRVVEERVFEAVGSNKSQPVRARLIAASNRALDREVAAERFRSDLYYRLNVVGFHLPPLHERRGTIRGLAARFVAEFAARNGREVGSIAEDAVRVLEAYDWPGNIRELRNTIERAVALCASTEVRIEDLPRAVVQGAGFPGRTAEPRPTEASPVSASRATLAQIKKEAELARITEALEKHGNNRLRAATELGISRMTLYKKLYKYGIMHHDGDATRGGVA